MNRQAYMREIFSNSSSLSWTISKTGVPQQLATTGLTRRELLMFDLKVSQSDKF